MTTQPRQVVGDPMRKVSCDGARWARSRGTLRANGPSSVQDHVAGRAVAMIGRLARLGAPGDIPRW